MRNKNIKSSNIKGLVSIIFGAMLIAPVFSKPGSAVSQLAKVAGGDADSIRSGKGDPFGPSTVKEEEKDDLNFYETMQSTFEEGSRPALESDVKRYFGDCKDSRNCLNPFHAAIPFKIDGGQQYLYVYCGRMVTVDDKTPKYTKRHYLVGTVINSDTVVMDFIEEESLELTPEVQERLISKIKGRGIDEYTLPDIINKQEYAAQVAEGAGEKGFTAVDGQSHPVSFHRSSSKLGESLILQKKPQSGGAASYWVYTGYNEKIEQPSPKPEIANKTYEQECQLPQDPQEEKSKEGKCKTQPGTGNREKVFKANRQTIKEAAEAIEKAEGSSGLGPIPNKAKEDEDKEKQ